MKNLRAYRMKHNLTQFELSRKLSCSQEMVAQLEAGTKEPGDALRTRIDRVLASSSEGSAARGPYSTKNGIR